VIFRNVKVGKMGGKAHEGGGNANSKKSGPRGTMRRPNWTKRDDRLARVKERAVNQQDLRAGDTTKKEDHLKRPANTSNSARMQKGIEPPETR